MKTSFKTTGSTTFQPSVSGVYLVGSSSKRRDDYFSLLPSNTEGYSKQNAKKVQAVLEARRITGKVGTG